MTKFALLVAIAALVPASPAFAQDIANTKAALAPTVQHGTAAVSATVGKMLYSTGGKQLGAIYRLDNTGAPQILLDGNLVTVPSSTLVAVDGRVETSLTKKNLLEHR